MTGAVHDPGGKVRLPLAAGVTGLAWFSACGFYRHLLTRVWDAGSPWALWIGMNPSMADAEVDDPTVRAEINYTRNVLRLGGYAKVNVMDYRVTDPRRLLGFDVEPQSPANLRYILDAAPRASIVIASWGALPLRLRPNAVRVEKALAMSGVKLWCRGFTADGSPRHGRGVRADAPLVPFPRQ